MPKESKTYDPGTTEGHRQLFVDAFALYPETDLRKFDHIMLSMPGRGNFAFGERDDLAIPYRGDKIRVALNQGSMSHFVLAHEFAHCLGLPDVYTYTGQVPEDAPRNPLGPWDLMSSAGQATGFVGWHRHKLGWMDDSRKAYLTEGRHEITLTPLDRADGTSLVVVPVTNPDSPSKVFVVECAQPLRLDQDAPKPGGIIIYSVDATRPSGQNPLILYPQKDKIHAAFHPGNPFHSDDAPFSLDVIEKTGTGAYRVAIEVR
jgi:M6 family metalloprotease-like protein